LRFFLSRRQQSEVYFYGHCRMLLGEFPPLLLESPRFPFSLLPSSCSHGLSPPPKDYGALSNPFLKTVFFSPSSSPPPIIFGILAATPPSPFLPVSFFSPTLPHLHGNVFYKSSFPCQKITPSNPSPPLSSLNGGLRSSYVATDAESDYLERWPQLGYS